ncbi:hypothetical protein Scep_020740 [Stephania cephalantha]|uniref:LOB domain-containing protein n=1 Tax=Stephania cephalantha TaxID=152367 RepID=A0AAP0IEA9_9MAGN
MASNSPCAACKFLRRKCIPDCPFAPYFPPDNPQKFTNVHKVFGASNVSKLLSELHTPAQKEDAVNSLAYEAQARLDDPVYGCVGHITNLSRQLSRVQQDLYSAKLELSQYLGPNAMVINPALIQPTSNPYVIHQQYPQHHHHHHHHQANATPSMPPAYGIQPHHMAALGGGGGGPSQSHFIVREPYHRRMDYEAQQLAVAYAREQELMRNLEQQQLVQQQQHQQQQQQQQQQIDLVRYQNYIGGFDASVVGGLNNQIQVQVQVSDGMNSTVPVINFDSQFQHQQQQQQQQINESEEEQQAQELMPLHEQQLLLSAGKSEEDNTSIGPPT